MALKTLAEFYQHAIHVTYAVVIGQSFFIAKDIFIPIYNLREYDSLVNALGLILAYFVVVTGWIGWYKSISKNPHTDGRLGIARFGTDLFIMFLFYYLISLASPSSTANYGDTFVWLFPIIYGAYLLWDGLKYFEYKHETAPERKARKNRALTTVIFLIVFVVQGWFYLYATNYLQDFRWGDKIAWEPVFIISSIIFILLYRRRKWLVKRKRRRRRA